MNFLTSDLFKKLNIRHGFFNRENGVSGDEFASRNVSFDIGDTTSNVEQNRQRCLEDIGAADAPLVFASKLGHSDRVFAAERPEKSHDIVGYDAIVTDQPNVALGLSTADCIPIFITDNQARAIAIVHAGWRGLVANVIAEAVQSLRAHYGIEPKEMIAAIGPAISVDNYEVGPEVAGQFDSQFVKKSSESLYLDITAVARAQLEETGIGAIDHCQANTFTDEKYYSHRRDKGKTGRQLSVICL